MISPQTIEQGIKSIGGPPSITRAFELMGVAEEEIKAAKKRHPARTNEIQDSFLALMPPPSMCLMRDDLYRSFAREILDQIGKGHKRSATNAEVAVCLYNTCLKSPIARDFAVAYWLAMKAALGEKKMAEVLGTDDIYTDEDLRAGRERLNEIKHDISRRLK